MTIDMPNKPNKMTDTFTGRAWHEDGTPFAPVDYNESGLRVPTLSQLALWARADREHAAEPGENLPSEKGLKRDALVAMDSGQTVPVAGGNVGGGTGRICHHVNGGSGTSLRPAEAADEAIINALVAAGTMIGPNDVTVRALLHDRLREQLRSYNREEG